MGTYYLVLTAHLLGASVWAGGHLVLALRILRRALRERRAATVSEYESAFERIGLPAPRGASRKFCLARHLLGAPSNWFRDTPIAHTVQLKLALVLGCRTRAQRASHGDPRAHRRDCRGSHVTSAP